jgi:hypothetical protein
MVRIFVFLLVATLVSACDEQTKRPPTLQELVKVILEEEFKKKEAEKDQLSRRKDSLVGGSEGEQEPDDPKNARKIKALVCVSKLRYSSESENGVLSELIRRISLVYKSLEEERVASFSRSYNLNSDKFRDPIFEVVKQNLDVIGGVLGDLEVMREFLGEQEITNNENDSKTSQKWKFWPLKSQTHSLGESIDRVAKVRESLTYAVGEYGEVMVNNDDRLFDVLLINLRVAVGGSLIELESVLGFLYYKFEKGESLYGPNDKFYRRAEEVAGGLGGESESTRAGIENTAPEVPQRTDQGSETRCERDCDAKEVMDDVSTVCLANKFF